MGEYELLSKSKYREIFHENGLWVKPDLHKHISKIVESELNNICRLICVDMRKKHKSKVNISDFDIAFTKYKESYLAEFIPEVMKRIKSNLDVYEKEVKAYYESYRDLPQSTE